jgi:phospholipase/carboxylesterase
MSALETVEILTGPNPVASVIWMHGLGADGNDFVPVVPELSLPHHLPIRFIFPHAPVHMITINFGMAMRAWYDIRPGGLQLNVDSAGIRNSVRSIHHLIEAEVERGIPANRIALAGFSQGGAIALATGTQYPEPLAGILALSTYLPVPCQDHFDPAHAHTEVPIFMGHGLQDLMVPHALGEQSRHFLEGKGFKVQWHDYVMGHSVCPQEIDHISLFLQSVLES